jgi:hypothetical protein
VNRRLVGTRIPKGRWTIRCDDNERNARVVGLENSGVEVGNGSSRCRDDCDGPFRLNSDAQSKECRNPFIDDDVKVDELAVSEGGGHESKRLRSRAG